MFNELDNWRKVTIRNEKTKVSCLGFVARASVKLWKTFVQET